MFEWETMYGTMVTLLYRLYASLNLGMCSFAAVTFSCIGSSGS